MDRIEIKSLLTDKCNKSCNSIINRFIKPDSNYIDYGKGSRWTGAIISLCNTYQNYCIEQKERYNGNILRAARKADKYFCNTFDRRTFIPDLHEINTSKEFRQRGKMKIGYLKSIEKMGGFPEYYYHTPVIDCIYHFNQFFGIFEKIEGYKQGNITTNMKLIGYIKLCRVGNIAFYSQILGHGDYLYNNDNSDGQKGIIKRLHLYVLNFCYNLQELEFLMYTFWSSGTPGLQKWKRQCLFTEKQLYYGKES